jgi:hypothetical protein
VKKKKGKRRKRNAQRVEGKRRKEREKRKMVVELGGIAAQEARAAAAAASAGALASAVPGGPEHQTEAVGLHKVAPAVSEANVTVAYAEVEPNQSPNMRQSTRWDYLTEYIAYWVDHKKFWVYTALFIIAGVWALGVFAPVGLLMIMIAAKFKAMAWMDDFIIHKFGANRTLVLVD